MGSIKYISLVTLLFVLIFSSVGVASASAYGYINVGFNQTTAHVGDTVNIIVTVTNPSVEDWSKVSVYAPIPDGLKYVSHVVPNKIIQDYDPNTGIWNVGSMRHDFNGYIKSLIITVKVSPEAAGQNLTATAKFTSLISDISCINIAKRMAPAKSTLTVLNTITGPGGGSGSGQGIDNIAPRITSTDPANNTVNIPANKQIKVTFHEPIKKGNMRVELKNSNGKIIPVTSSVSGNILTINHSALLAEGKYQLILHTGSITDLAGNPLAFWASKFSVGTSLKIISSNPANNAVNVARNKVITITFNEPIKAGNMWIELKGSDGSTVPIYRIISGNTLTIKHSALLKAGTRYQLILHTGSITDLAGNPIAFKSTSFTTRKT
ncbi:Ig-like domain-containing protein [Methanobacterium oryzae]|uniref:Ig-like domain-containing protein n=1 Tax=Methanobacterium oryzae TaxID=69540 RepID=UPI003D192273